MKLLTGEKSLLTPMVPTDIEYMLQLYRDQASGKLYKMEKDDEVKTIDEMLNAYDTGIFKGWIVYALHKNKKDTKKVGVVFLTDPGDHQVLVNGIVDKEYMKGLGKHLKNKDSKPITQEAYELVVKYCLTDLHKERVEAQVECGNALALKLSKRVGFVQEGVLRKKVPSKDGRLLDFVILSIIKDDLNKGGNHGNTNC